MRYYYYGKEPDVRQSSRWDGSPEHGRSGDRGGRLYGREQTIYDDDTIYEIDEKCEECRKKGISPMR